MVTDATLGIFGTLFGTIAGSIVGGWFGLRQTKIQQEAANNRHRADAFLGEKAERLAKLYDYLIDVIGFASPYANKDAVDVSDGLVIHDHELDNLSFPSSTELLRAQKRSMLFISEEDGIKRINRAVGLWIPILRQIEDADSGPIQIRWEDVPMRNELREYPDRPLSREEVAEISDQAIDVLRYEMYNPISEL